MKSLVLALTLAALSGAAFAQDYTAPIANPFGDEKLQPVESTPQPPRDNERDRRTNPTGGQVSDQEFDGLVQGADRRSPNK
ncbi:MAG: hypothetical protein HC836_47015 [Richelia sp. RM2_1_2]|nr:hypothetical protein [Richelia sp. RM2_1_2]